MEVEVKENQSYRLVGTCIPSFVLFARIKLQESRDESDITGIRLCTEYAYKALYA